MPSRTLRSIANRVHGHSFGVNVLALTFLVLGLSACAIDDGKPWGYIEGNVRVAEPNVAASFEITDYTVEIATVRLAVNEASSAMASGGDFDPMNPPPGCNLCHNGHCHCDGELIDYEDLEARMAAGGGTSRRVLANFQAAQPLTDTTPVTLGRQGINERITLDRVEVELAAVRVDGRITRGGETHPAVLSLPGIAGTRIAADTSLSVGPEAPVVQRLELTLQWPEAWLANVDLDTLAANSDGEIILSSISNNDAAVQASQAVNAGELSVAILEP